MEWGSRLSFDSEDPFGPFGPILNSGEVWSKPTKFNQGDTNDGLFVDRNKGLLRFVKFTIQKKHTFKYEFYTRL